MEQTVIRLAWTTDLHLEFLDATACGVFYDELLNAAADFVVLSGDIGTANNVEGFLAGFDRFLPCPVLFVLGMP